MKRLMILLLISALSVSICVSQPRSRRHKIQKVIQLPGPRMSSSIGLEDVLVKQIEVRNFTGQTLGNTEIGQLAWAGHGVTEKEKGTGTTSVIGAPVTIKLYLATEKGIFRYNSNEHSLESVSELDIRERVVSTALPEEKITDPACLIIVISEIQKMPGFKGSRVRKMTQLKAGHIAQNIQLQAVTLGLGSSTISFFDVNIVRRLCRLQNVSEPVYIIGVGYPSAEKKGDKIERIREIGRTKTAVLIVPHKNYRDEELILTKGMLDQAAVRTFVASSRVGTITGMLGGKAEASVFLNVLNVADYDAVIFIGGSGAKEYFQNPTALEIARQAKNMNKVIGAICMAPTILANAGIVNGLRVTGYPTEQEQIRKGGAVYTGNPLERDGQIITAIGPAASRVFANALVEALVEEK
ncbi:MAG: DJ-1/PfpI family protein [Planctomycetota bacterium]